MNVNKLLGVAGAMVMGTRRGGRKGFHSQYTRTQDKYYSELMSRGSMVSTTFHALCAESGSLRSFERSLHNKPNALIITARITNTLLQTMSDIFSRHGGIKVTTHLLDTNVDDQEDNKSSETNEDKDVSGQSNNRDENEDEEDKSRETEVEDDDKRNNIDVTDNSRTSNIYDDDDDLINAGGKLGEFARELENIIGLHNLKMKLRQWAKGMILDDKRRAMGLDLGPRKQPHMVFLGNPGTGKTTVARILGKLLHSTGVLSDQKLTEVQRTDLVGKYIGQTGPKTREKIRGAKGGILFVDKAYRLSSPDSSKDYGLEALEEIMSVLEDEDIVVIFAGYTEPMKRMLDSNPGFYRRVMHLVHFEDYSCRELAEMLMLKMSEQDKTSRLCGFRLDGSCDYESVLALIEKGSTEDMRCRMNGGLVDHMLNNARENLDLRLSLNCKGDELFTITLGDLEAGLRVLAERTKFD